MAIVIAEIGENHCGNMEWAKELIRVAARAGCDYAKFQLYNAAKTANNDPERDWFFKVQLDDQKLTMLIDECRKHGIKFLCTPWDRNEAEILKRHGAEEAKVASFLIADEDMLRYLNQNMKRVFISSGMCSFEELDRAIALLDKVEVCLMHCVSEYPLQYQNVNLRMMDTLRKRYPHAKIGYSDHTIGILAPVAAAARGAEIIEKHVTLDKAMEGTDHILSADPEELFAMTEQIRIMGKLLGSPEKVITPKEKKNQTFLRNRFHHTPSK